MLEEFKKFALKGNVLDMAIGVVIGGAFGKIVSSLVENIIMPIVSMLTAGVSVEELSYTFPGTSATIGYGVFLQNIIDFIIIAFSIFMFIRLANRLLHKKAEEEPEPETPAEPTSEELLTEIRDLLKK